MATIEDYPKEKAKYLVKLSKVAKQGVKTFNEESVAASSSASEASATESAPKQALMKKSGVKPKSSTTLSKQQNPQPAPSVAGKS